MSDVRLGDVIDDYCTRCRLLTNHSVVALHETTVLKVRCRTCHHDHQYRHGKGGAKRRKLSAYEQVLASINAPPAGLTPTEAKPKRARKDRSESRQDGAR